MLVFVKELRDLLLAKGGRNFRIILKKGPEMAFAAPGAHRVGLDQPIGILPADPGLGQGQQHLLGMDQTALAIQVRAHAIWVDDQLVDQARRTGESKIKRDG